MRTIVFDKILDDTFYDTETAEIIVESYPEERIVREYGIEMKRITTFLRLYETQKGNWFTTELVNSEVADLLGVEEQCLTPVTKDEAKKIVLTHLGINKCIEIFNIREA